MLIQINTTRKTFKKYNKYYAELKKKKSLIIKSTLIYYGGNKWKLNAKLKIKKFTKEK